MQAIHFIAYFLSFAFLSIIQQRILLLVLHQQLEKERVLLTGKVVDDVSLPIEGVGIADHQLHVVVEFLQAAVLRVLDLSLLRGWVV